MSAVTLRTTVEEALKEQCPDITEVRQVPEEPEEEKPAVAVVQLDLPAKAGKLTASGWFAEPAVDDLSDGRGVVVDTPNGKVVLVKGNGGIRAYRNECAHQGLPLDGGTVDPEANTITCPWHGFRFDCDTGECLTAPAAQLEQFPVRVENGVVWVRPS
jgi:nitrite reductase/ring-hydroxylating ferredoxin subunit